MARSRNIKPAFFDNEYLAETKPYTRLLFIGLWTLADRQGRLENRVKRIKGKIFPYEEVDVESCLNELESATEQFLFRYEVDGKSYIQITNFLKHQSPHMKEVKSIIPEAPDKLGASKVQEPKENSSSPPDSLNLIPLTLNPINDVPDKKEVFSENVDLNNTIYDFIEMRKKIKKPMTDNAVVLMIRKLNKFTDNDDDKIQILENSIMNSWQGIFELKKPKEEVIDARRYRQV